MRLHPLLTFSCLASVLTLPALAQQNQELRDEIRRIVREEVRAALRDAMREIHGAQGMLPVPPRAERVEAEDEVVQRRPPQPPAPNRAPARPEVRQLENEIRELEATLDKLQAEIGKRARPEQPVREKLDGGTLELRDGVHVLRLGDGGQPLEIRLEGGDEGKIHFVTPKQGQRRIELREESEGRDDEKAEKPKANKTPKQVQKIEEREEEEEGEEAERAERKEKAEKAEKKAAKKKSANAATG
jgi:hypothetical protein